jgi:hypothetical protein
MGGNLDLTAILLSMTGNVASKAWTNSPVARCESGMGMVVHAGNC